MPISGRIAAASRLGLEDLLERKLLEEKMAAHQQQQAIDNAMRDREQTFRETSHQDTVDMADRDRRDRSNRAGVTDMLNQRGIMDAEAEARAGEALAADPSTPPALRRLFGLKKAGINASPSADMLRSPEEIAAAQQAADERELGMHGAKRAIDARFKPPTAPKEKDRHPHVVDGKTVYLTEDEVNARGGVEPTPRQRPVSGAERQTLAFYQRAEQGNEIAKSLEDDIAKSSLLEQVQLQQPFNVLQSKTQQSYRQAQRAFTEARLRKESGAAIPQGEYDNDARTYFAQPGDSPEVIAQKQAARETVLEGLANATGAAWEEFFGEPRPKSTRGAPRTQDGQKPAKKFQILSVK